MERSLSIDHDEWREGGDRDVCHDQVLEGARSSEWQMTLVIIEIGTVKAIVNRCILSEIIAIRFFFFVMDDNQAKTRSEHCYGKFKSIC